MANLLLVPGLRGLRPGHIGPFGRAHPSDPRVLTISAHEHPPLDPSAATPELWRQYVSWTTSRSAPERMTEGAPGSFADYEAGHDPADPVDRAIMATRRAVFPHHGLMP